MRTDVPCTLTLHSEDRAALNETKLVDGLDTEGSRVLREHFGDEQVALVHEDRDLEVS